MFESFNSTPIGKFFKLEERGSDVVTGEETNFISASFCDVTLL